MSYDISFRPPAKGMCSNGHECGTCQNAPYIDPTTNLAPAFRIVFDEPNGVHVLHGSLAGDCIQGINNALNRYQEKWHEVDAALAVNGNDWGTPEDVAEVLETLLRWCILYPTFLIEVRN